MKNITMKKIECTRCQHVWITRKPCKPRICPKCKSAYWDVLPTNKRQAKTA